MNSPTLLPSDELRPDQVGVLPSQEPIEVTVVIPCLNEADTLATCIAKALRELKRANIQGEVLVADNGSTDGSPQIAEAAGARVLHVAERGYGSALQAGIAAARGKYIVMGDADDSYDFQETPKYVNKLREGYDLVQGCRFPSGGGKIQPGAMPFLHRWWGNPMFSKLAQWWFGVPVHDIYCGMRGFTKECYQRLRQRCTGMEFATEMIIRASLYKAKIAEVPTTLHPDGRKAHAPHLKTFRDGWRTLRFFMLYSPRWLFLAPGLALMLLGLIGYAVALPGLTISKVTFDVHTLLFASLALMCGLQASMFALFTKMYAIQDGLLPPDRRLERFFKVASLERGLVLSALAWIAGFALMGSAIHIWWQSGFGHLDYAHTMRLVIPGATLISLAVQTVFSSFFFCLMLMHRR